MDSLAHRLNNLLAYIESDLSRAIPLEELEFESGLSRFQLIRLFKRLCGYTPAEYMRRRRLSNAIPDLYAKKRIIDVALDSGFEYEQSFIRAFRSVYGISPARLGRTSHQVDLFEPIRLDAISVHSDRLVTAPQTRYIQKLALTGEELFYNYKDNNVRGRPLIDGVSRLKHGLFTGICIPQGRGTFGHRYIRSIPGSQRNDVTYTLPEGKYVVFHYAGLHPLDETGAHKIRTLTYIVIGSWAAENGVVWDENFVEQVDKKALSNDYCEVQVMIPLRTVEKASRVLTNP